MILTSKLAPVLVAVLMVACATPAEIRTQTPALKVESKLPSKLVAICITENWEGAGLFGLPMPVYMRQIKNGFTVFIRDFHNRTTLIVDIEDTSSGSKSALYDNFGPGVDDFVDIVKRCQRK